MACDVEVAAEQARRLRLWRHLGIWKGIVDDLLVLYLASYRLDCCSKMVVCGLHLQLWRLGRRLGIWQGIVDDLLVLFLAGFGLDCCSWMCVSGLHLQL